MIWLTFVQANLLRNRTGTEVLLIAVRSDCDDYLAPFSFTTTERIDDFFKLILGNTITQFSGKLESFFLSGIEGMSFITKIIIYRY